MRSTGFKTTQAENVGDIDVEFIPHTTLNTTSGVLVCTDLLNLTEEEIATELAPQGDIACRRLR